MPRSRTAAESAANKGRLNSFIGATLPLLARRRLKPTAIAAEIHIVDRHVEIVRIHPDAVRIVCGSRGRCNMIKSTSSFLWHISRSVPVPSTHRANYLNATPSKTL